MAAERRRTPPLPRLRAVRPRAAGRTTPEFSWLAATVAVLAVLGLVMTFSASFVQSAALTGDVFGIFQRQLVWCLLGLPVMAGAAMTDYRRWRPFAGVLVVGALVASVVVLFPGVGVEVQGAQRWIEVGPLRFQPSELLKLTIPLYLAHVLARRWARLRAGDLHGLLMPAVPLLAVTALLVMGQPDLETAGLVMAVGGLVLFAAGLPGRILAVGLAGTGLFAAVAIATTGFRRDRIAAWLNPMSDPGNLGYQTVQGYIALGSGGWLGRGLGQGRGQWLYIPNAHTDFIYAIIGEELGLVGALFVLGLFTALAIAGVRTARRAPDPFGRLLATGIVGWLLLQAAMNIGSVVGLLPVTGVTLPLVSFGGSSLLVTMLGCGVLMSISRQAVEPSPAAPDAADDESVSRPRGAAR